MRLIIRPPRPRSRLKWEARAGLTLIMPWILGVLIFKLVPIAVALGYSLTDFRMLAPDEWRFVGLENYARFLGDPDAGGSLFGSLGYLLGTLPLQMAAALGLAVLFSSGRLRGKGFLRPLFFMPAIIPATSIIFVWAGLADPYGGWLIKLVIEPLGLPPLAGQVGGGLFAVFIALWSIGPSFLIMLGAMQGVSPELHDAARVDGAGPVMRLFAVTLPMISPAIFFSLVINMTSAFGGSVLIDRGFPFQGGFSPMENYINFTMFSLGRLGYASALTWVMFAVVISMTLLLFRSARSWVYFPEEQTQDDL